MCGSNSQSAIYKTQHISKSEPAFIVYVHHINVMGHKIEKKIATILLTKICGISVHSYVCK